MYLPFDLRELRFFLVVAEEENLGRAAIRLNVTASPLSRRIRELEEKLEVQLFHHEKKRVKLTSAGHALAEDVRRFLGEAEELNHRIEDIKKGIDQSIHLGYVSGAMVGGFLPGVIAKMKALDNNAQFRLHPMRSREQINAIHRGAIELALVHTPPLITEGLAIVLLQEDTFSLVVPKHSAITDIPSAKILNEQTWISFSEGYSPTFRQQFSAACQQLGFEADIAYQAQDILSMMGLIESGLGVGILQSKLSRIAPDTVRFIPFTEFPLAVKIYGIYRKGNASNVVNKFLDVAKK